MAGLLAYAAAGALAGYGDGLVEDAKYQREMALEALREQRKSAERQEDRDWRTEEKGLDRENQATLQGERLGQQAAQHQETLALREDLANQADSTKRELAGMQADLRRDLAAQNEASKGSKAPSDVETAKWLAERRTAADAGDAEAAAQIAAYDTINEKTYKPADRVKMISDMVGDAQAKPGGRNRPVGELIDEAGKIVDELEKRYGVTKPKGDTPQFAKPEPKLSPMAPTRDSRPQGLGPAMSPSTPKPTAPEPKAAPTPVNKGQLPPDAQDAISRIRASSLPEDEQRTRIAEIRRRALGQ